MIEEFLKQKINSLEAEIEYLKKTVACRDKMLIEAEGLLEKFLPSPLSITSVYVPEGKKVISRRACWVLVKE